MVLTECERNGSKSTKQQIQEKKNKKNKKQNKAKKKKTKKQKQKNWKARSEIQHFHFLPKAMNRENIFEFP